MTVVAEHSVLVQSCLLLLKYEYDTKAAFEG